MSFFTNEKNETRVGNIIFVVISLILLAIIVILVVSFGVKIYSRYQTRMDAQNEVAVNEIKIKQQEQLIQVEKQKAEIRIVEAGGIAESQKIIDSSLTNNYLQYLAIQAQEKMAGSPNHTQIYIPVGTNGIPLIKTIE